MAKQTVQYRQSSRRIERVVSKINHTITNAANADTLHTVEDRKILVRTILQLCFIPQGAVGQYNLVLHRLPRGNSVGSPATGEDLDNDHTKEQIWEYQGGFMAGSLEPQNVIVDLKSMRKLDPGDLLTLKTISSVANCCTVTGIVQTFFKE